jgi:hypothetical protein
MKSVWLILISVLMLSTPYPICWVLAAIALLAAGGAGSKSRKQKQIVD